jgi:uncharacterized protein
MGRAKPPRESYRWLRFVTGHPRRVLFAALLMTAVFAWPLPQLRFETSIYDLAIEDLPETETYRTFKKEFGCEEILLVVARAEDIFVPKTFQEIEGLAESLARIEGVRRVISLPGIRKDMDVTGDWDIQEFARNIEPVKLFQRNLISDDHRATVVTLVLEDVENKDRVVREVQDRIRSHRDGLSLYQIGMPLVSRALAEYTEKDFQRLPPITFVAIALVLFLFFRNIRGVLIPAGSVLIALVWTFGLMAWTGIPLSMLTMIVPIFIIAVGTAYCMYILPSYLGAFHENATPREAAFSCFSRLAFPTVLAVVTTTVGLGSLLVNRIHSIREFALFACFGIWCMLGIILIVLPAALSLLPAPKKARSGMESGRGIMGRILDAVVQLNFTHQRWTLSAVVLLSLVGIAGILQIRVETNPVGYFKPNTEIRRQFHDIYRDMAGSFPVNLVLDSGTEDYFEDPEHLMILEKIAPFLESLEGVDKTISFADYFKLVNYASNRYEKAFYALPEEGFEVRMLMNSYKTMLGQDMFERFMSADLSKANVLLRTHIASSEQFLVLRDKILEHLQSNLPEGMTVAVTGFGLVISQSSRLLTQGQVKSLSLTLVLIFGIMFFLFLSWKVGLIAIVPNCFPLIMNFGIMGWLGVELSVATSLIASIAIGLAVDDTIHYLVQYNREFKKDLDKERALRDTVRSVGRPIIFTTLTIGVGFSVLAFSHFKPTAVFGLMMMITMGSALIGDLLVLPSLMTHVELVTVWDLLRIKLGKDPQEGIPLFKGLSRNQVHYILMAGALHQYESGRILFRQGETSDSMYAVISGQLEVVDVLDETDPDSIHGSKRLIATLEPGNTVGEMGMVRSCKRSATVIVSKPSELLQINDRMIRRLHWLYPPTAQRFFFNLMSGVCDRLESATRCLSDMSYIDGLTGLLTRDHFRAALDLEIERALRYESEFSLCLLDLDNFQAVNQTYGHAAGDFVLSEVGAFFREHMRKSDASCRYSGQQFAFFLVNSAGEKGRNACERLRKRLADHVFTDNGTPLHVTASIGMVSMNPRVAESGEELLDLVSRALRRAKQEGKNRVEVYD